MKLTFMQRLMRGDQGLDINDFIDKWHDGPYSNQLHEFLGMTWEEYKSWSSGKKSPEEILNDRMSS